ncbi:MAG: asparagine--tRNA ligase [Candidatus Pacearchaeota archaeon]|nr:asparagine--tRNA ligase [Candidatus Pacearchaeota archaeon]
MQEFMSIQEALEKKEGNVSIRGWVYRVRKHKEKIFIVVRDSTDIIQAIVTKENPSLFEKAKKLTIESSLMLAGKLRKEQRAPNGYEIEVASLEIVGLAEPFPITKDLSEEFLLDVRHLALRSRRLVSSLKIRSTVLFALHECLHKKGFVQVDAPIITPITSEGGAETFKVDYFKKKAFLTQSWQFYGETLVSSFEKVYTIAPSFRAEKSRTPRHLTEFWHCEVEQAWASMEDMINVAQDCIMYSIKKVLENNQKELSVLGVEEEYLKKIKAPFPRITYEEAIRLLRKKYEIEYGQDFGAKEEKEIAKQFDNFVVITNYPLSILKFYHGEDPKMPGTGMNFNIFAPEVGEIVDGSAREPDLKKIKERLKKAKIKLKKAEWYLDSRRYGSVPHAGFGLGVERLVQWICKLDNIRDAIAFPRTLTRLEP